MNNFLSLLLYIIIFSISILAVGLYEKTADSISVTKKGAYALLIMFPIIVLQGLRYDVGTDYLSYSELVYGFNNDNTTYLSWYKNEPLFIIICRISYLISNGSVFFFFIIDAVLMNVVLFCIADYYKVKKEISITWLYIAYYMLCFPYFLNTERQGLAVLIIWLATKYAREKKFMKFLICVATATMIHNTAIVGVVFYLFNFIDRDNKLVQRIFYCLAIGMPFVFGVSVNFLSEKIPIFYKYTKFLTSGHEETANVNFIFSLFLMTILYFIVKKYKGDRLDYFWVSALCLLQLSSYLLNSYIDWGFRMSYYFQIGMIYAYGFVVNRIMNTHTRLIIKGGYLICLFFHFIYKFYVQGNCEIFPYRFIWDV